MRKTESRWGWRLPSVGHHILEHQWHTNPLAPSRFSFSDKTRASEARKREEGSRDSGVILHRQKAVAARLQRTTMESNRKSTGMETRTSM
mmetsp:Transcript_22153/g.36636  ORF Transcript_22153/g.36636 Transcript_22153/m.36636 type:complete len:90 (-) Transcript_22153:106-375(-)